MKANAVAAAAENRCTQLLTSGLDMLKPGNMGISAQEQQVVDALNNWAGECGKSTDSPANDPPATKGATPTVTAKGAGGGSTTSTAPMRLRTCTTWATSNTSATVGW